jgi:hypothetical protein
MIYRTRCEYTDHYTNSNQMPQMEGQTTQWPNERADNGRQNTTKKNLMIEQHEHYWAFKLEVAFRFNSKVSGRPSHQLNFRC